jgi:hypothetical protein
VGICWSATLGTIATRFNSDESWHQGDDEEEDGAGDDHHRQQQPASRVLIRPLHAAGDGGPYPSLLGLASTRSRGIECTRPSMERRRSRGGCGSGAEDGAAGDRCSTEGRCEGDASGGRGGRPAEVRANKKNNHEMLAPRRDDGNGGRIFSLILSMIEGGLGGA